MKTLADESASHSKVVVLGITNAGQSLISFGKDLANRIEVIPFDANPDFKVDELIRKGEEALNIKINVRQEISQCEGGRAVTPSSALCLRLSRQLRASMSAGQTFPSMRSAPRCSGDACLE
jgi:hypothetical protein